MANHLILPLAISISISANAGLILDPPTADPCWDQYQNEKSECNSDFNNPDQPDNQDSGALSSCLSGAEENYAVCRDGLTNDEYGEAWERFLDRLADCVSDHPDDAISRESCIATALMAYRFDINDLLFPDDDDDDECGPQLGDIALLNPMNTLSLAAIDLGNSDGKYPIFVNTSLAFQSGININSNSGYLTQAVPCLKTATAIAIYATKTGSTATSFDADLDTSNGTSFTYHAASENLVHASEVILLTVFYDEFNRPQLGEYGILTIQESPISGDWNRDEVLNTQDVIDFLDSYNALTERADVNGDNQVNTQDAIEFTEDYVD